METTEREFDPGSRGEHERGDGGPRTQRASEEGERVEAELSRSRVGGAAGGVGGCGRAGLRAKELASRLGHPAWRPAVAPKKVNLRKVSDHRRLKKKSKASGRRKKKTSKIGRSQRTEIKMALDFATLKILSHKLSFFQLNVEKYKLPL